MMQHINEKLKLPLALFKKGIQLLLSHKIIITWYYYIIFQSTPNLKNQDCSHTNHNITLVNLIKNIIFFHSNFFIYLSLSF